MGWEAKDRVNFFIKWNVGDQNKGEVSPMHCFVQFQVFQEKVRADSKIINLKIEKLFFS